jgi:hypothetical protein
MKHIISGEIHGGKLLHFKKYIYFNSKESSISKGTLVDLSMRLQIPKTITQIVGGSPWAMIAHHPYIVYDLLGGSFTCSSYPKGNVAFWDPLECLIVMKG